MSAPQIVQKLWNYCNILRDDGLSYGDYVEQLTFDSVAPAPSAYGSFCARSVSLASRRLGSAFDSVAPAPSASRPTFHVVGLARLPAARLLKMADEQSRPPSDRVSPIPAGFGWDVRRKG